MLYLIVSLILILENGNDGGGQETLLLSRDPRDRGQVLQDSGGHWEGESQDEKECCTGAFI